MFKSTATEAYTGKLSSSYEIKLKTNRNFPQLPINQSVEHKKGQKSMRGVTKRHVGTSGELRLASEWSHGRVALTCSSSGELPFMSFTSALHQIGAFCPKYGPGKTKFYMQSK